MISYNSGHLSRLEPALPNNKSIWGQLLLCYPDKHLTEVYMHTVSYVSTHTDVHGQRPCSDEEQSHIFLCFPALCSHTSPWKMA